MARLIGLDIRSGVARGVFVQTSFRKTRIASVVEYFGTDEEIREWLENVIRPTLSPTDLVAVGLGTERLFFHRVSLHQAVMKQVEEVLLFEIESLLPIDIEDVVFDYRTLPKHESGDQFVVTVAAARTTDVESLITSTESAIGVPPKKVVAGASSLSNLGGVCASFRGQETTLILELGQNRSDVALLFGGYTLAMRSLPVGLQDLPNAEVRLCSLAKQTLAAWKAAGIPEPVRVHVLGAGFLDEFSQGFEAAVGLPVQMLAQLEAEIAPSVDIAQINSWIKPLSLALSMRGRSHDLDLRKGPLSFGQSYEFLRAKAPVLIAAFAGIFISFLFFAWAKTYSLTQENEAQEARLLEDAREVLGVEVADVAEVIERLDSKEGSGLKDPQPLMDAVGILSEYSKLVSFDITHDIEEFDISREKVRVEGLVDSAAEAQQIVEGLKKHECFDEVKMNRVSQLINSTRQKYSLEFVATCASTERSSSGKAAKRGSAAKKSEGTRVE